MTHTEAMATVELGGDERDVLVRAYVESVRLYGGSRGFAIDGDIEAFVDGKWTDFDSLDTGKRDRELASEAICDAAEADLPSEPCGVPAFWTGRYT